MRTSFTVERADMRPAHPTGVWARTTAARPRSNKSWALIVVGLTDRLKGVGAGVATDSLALRVRALTGNGCGNRQFQCGGDAPQCLSNILVCDGSVDCRNGNDESSATCTNPYSSGSAFSGSIRFTSCALKGKAQVRVVITSENAMAGRAELTATVILQMDNGQVIAENTSGKYWFGSQNLQIEPTPKWRLGVKCNYNSVDGSCTGTLVNNGGSTCAAVVLS